jgi:hypothetical protein
LGSIIQNLHCEIIFPSIGGRVTHLTLELASFSTSNFTLIGRSVGGPVTPNWLEDGVILMDYYNPFYTFSLELEKITNYLSLCPYKAMLVMTGYRPGVYTYRVLNRSSGPRSRSITIEGECEQGWSCLTA